MRCRNLPTIDNQPQSQRQRGQTFSAALLGYYTVRSPLREVLGCYGEERDGEVDVEKGIH